MRHEVRTLTPADQPNWRRLRLQALERYPAAFLTTAGEQRARPASVDRAALSGGNWRGLFLSHEMIGIGALIPKVQDACAHRVDIGAFFVIEDHWGSNAGQFFLDALESEARKRGALQMELSVASDNPRAIRFYERNGFERFGMQPRAVILDGHPVDDFFYVKMLDR